MSKLTQSDFDQARETIRLAGAKPENILEALEAVRSIQARWMAQERIEAWSKGLRGDGVACIAGLTDTETGLVRCLLASTIVRHSEFDDLYRTVCALRAKLEVIAPSVEIRTLTKIGYELVAGFTELHRLLRPANTDTLKILDFTERQSELVRHLATYGSVHVNLGKAVQRHMSNIKKKLKRHDPKIAIETIGGEGLYQISDKARERLNALIAAGEKTEAPKAAPAKLRPPSKPKLIPKPKRKEETALLAA